MDLEDTLLMMPGPVPVVPRILRAMSKPMINHRSAEFGAIYDECRENLADVFRTKNEIFILSGSGSCAMEAAVGNIVNRDDTVIAIENGKFGERFTEIIPRYCNLRTVISEWGTPIDLDGVAEALEEGAAAVTLINNETSAGILNPAAEVGKLAHKHDALFIMDGVTSIGGDNVDVDKWGADIAIVGSQKCMAGPPGLSMISVSDRAWERIEKCDNRPYYGDLAAYRKSGSKAQTQTPYTPAVSLFYAMQEALRIVKEEGMEARIRRHHAGSASVRAAAGALGIEMFPQLDANSSYSNTVTAMKAPEGIDGNDIKAGMIKRGIIIAGGQARLSGKIFRIGSMGNFTARDMLTTIGTLELVLRDLGVVDTLGEGVEAAQAVLEKI